MSDMKINHIKITNDNINVGYNSVDIDYDKCCLVFDCDIKCKSDYIIYNGIWTDCKVNDVSFDITQVIVKFDELYNSIEEYLDKDTIDFLRAFFNLKSVDEYEDIDEYDYIDDLIDTEELVKNLDVEELDTKAMFEEYLYMVNGEVVEADLDEENYDEGAYNGTYIFNLDDGYDKSTFKVEFDPDFAYMLAEMGSEENYEYVVFFNGSAIDSFYPYEDDEAKEKLTNLIREKLNNGEEVDLSECRVEKLWWSLTSTGWKDFDNAYGEVIYEAEDDPEFKDRV